MHIDKRKVDSLCSFLGTDRQVWLPTPTNSLFSPRTAPESHTACIYLLYSAFKSLFYSLPTLFEGLSSDSTHRGGSVQLTDWKPSRDSLRSQDTVQLPRGGQGAVLEHLHIWRQIKSHLILNNCKRAREFFSGPGIELHPLSALQPAMGRLSWDHRMSYLQNHLFHIFQIRYSIEHTVNALVKWFLDLPSGTLIFKCINESGGNVLLLVRLPHLKYYSRE